MYFIYFFSFLPKTVRCTSFGVILRGGTWQSTLNSSFEENSYWVCLRKRKLVKQLENFSS